MNASAQPSRCVNIGRQERQKRLAVGIGMCAVGIGLAVVLVSVGAPRWWRAGLVVPYWVGVLGVVQALSSTCVMLAARGLRHLDVGEERIDDHTLNTQLRRRARNIHVISVTLAAILTALCVAW